MCLLLTVYFEKKVTSSFSENMSEENIEHYGTSKENEEAAGAKTGGDLGCSGGMP